MGCTSSIQTKHNNRGHSNGGGIVALIVSDNTNAILSWLILYGHTVNLN